jgi:hypothetical protein
MPQSGKCPQAETIASIIDGDPTGEERVALETHLAECRECFQVLTESTEVWWRLDDAAKREKPREPQQ